MNSLIVICVLFVAVVYAVQIQDHIQLEQDLNTGRSAELLRDRGKRSLTKILALILNPATVKGRSLTSLTAVNYAKSGGYTQALADFFKLTGKVVPRTLQNGQKGVTHVSANLKQKGSRELVTLYRDHNRGTTYIEIKQGKRSRTITYSD